MTEERGFFLSSPALKPPPVPSPGGGWVAFFWLIFHSLRVVGPSFDFSVSFQLLPATYYCFLSETVESFVLSSVVLWCGGWECRDNVLFTTLLSKHLLRLLAGLGPHFPFVSFDINTCQWVLQGSLSIGISR